MEHPDGWQPYTAFNFGSSALRCPPPCDLEIIFETIGMPNSRHPVPQAVSASGLVGFTLIRSGFGVHIRIRRAFTGGACGMAKVFRRLRLFCFLMTI